MSDDNADRIRKLEAEIEALKTTVKPGQTPVHGIALAVGLIIFLFVVSKLSFPGDPSFWPRAGIAVACLIASGVIYSGALSVADFTFKAVVEIAGALLFLCNAIYCSLIWSFSLQFKQWVIDREIAQGDEATGVVVLVAAAALLALNVFALLIIYPAAKTAGTKLDL